MKKTLVSLMLCVMLIMQIPCALAYEYTPYIGDTVICSTPVTVKFEKKVSNGEDSSFETVDKIEDATRITASCNVKPGTEYDGSDVEVSLIVVGYKGIFFKDFAVAPATFTSSDNGVKSLSAQLDITDLDVDGVKVYLWDSVGNARPMLNKGVPGSNDNAIDGIIIGGEAVKIDPDKTGAVVVNAGYVEWPDVVVLTNDSSADVKVDLQGAFPLSKPLHTMLDSNPGDTMLESDKGVMGTSEKGVVTIKVGDETYIIDVTQKTPQITNVEFRKYKKDMATSSVEYYTDTQLKIQYDVQNPVWTDAFPGPDVEDSTLRSQDYYKTINTLENVSWAYSDTLGNNGQNAMFFDNIAPELLGSQFFATPWVSASNTSTIDDCFKFTIDRSARVYMAYKDGSKLLDRSWKRAYNNMFPSNNAMYGRMFYEMRINPTATTHTYQLSFYDQVYYKDYIVEPGETLDISLPAGLRVPRIFVKYMDAEFVTKAFYTVDGTKETAAAYYMAQPNYRDDSLVADKYELYTAPSSTTVPLYFGSGNVIYATAPFYETDKREFALMTVPEELVGATTLRTPYTLSGTVKYEFDISQSARVYVFTNAGNETGNTDVDTIKASLGDDWNNTDFEGDVAIGYRVDNNNVYDGITNESSFYRDYIVQPDDGGKVSITLDNITGDTRVIIVVDQLEDQLEE